MLMADQSVASLTYFLYFVSYTSCIIIVFQFRHHIQRSFCFPVDFADLCVS